MSTAPFPEQIDAIRLFAKNGEIKAELPLIRLLRLSEYLVDTDGQLHVELSFDHDEEGRRRLNGSLSGVVKQLCQRCLHPLPVTLECSFSLPVVASEKELKELSAASAKDAIIEDGEGLDVFAVIEDELILSLPLVPAHDEASCNDLLNKMSDGHGTAGKEGGASSNPFAVLAALKSDK